MRTLLALCCAVALGGCAIVINPNDGEVRYADTGGNAIQGNEQVSRDVRQVSTINTLDIDLALCCAVALGGCAIVINPNDGEVRYADTGGNAIQGNEQVSRDVRQVSTINTLDIDNMKRIDMKIDVRVGPWPCAVPLPLAVAPSSSTPTMAKCATRIQTAMPSRATSK